MGGGSIWKVGDAKGVDETSRRWGIGKGVSPSTSDLGERRVLPSGVRGTAPAETEFCKSEHQRSRLVSGCTAVLTIMSEGGETRDEWPV